MKVSRWSVLLMAAAFLAACGGGAPSGGGAATGSPNTLTAVKVDSATLDAAAGFWANAPKLDVAAKAAAKGNPDGPTVTLQAVYDGQNIVVRAEWADATDSWTRNVWRWDGTAFKRSGEQDRLAFTFPIGNNADFASKGCGAICHNEDTDKEKWWMGTGSADTRADLWQWQSAQTNPAGYADDQWWGPRQPITATTGRKSDANDGGGPKSNATKDNKAPAFMSSKGMDARYILSGEETALDMSKVTTSTIIPGYVLAPWKGSRGDITAKGEWANGKWVVVISRALNTSHDDDFVLTPPKAVPFGLAVFDNSGDLDHAIVQDVLTLAWK